MLKFISFIALIFYSSSGLLAQVNFVKTGMPTSFCQTGYAEISNSIYVPLTLGNGSDAVFHSQIDVYDFQGVKTDSIKINSAQHDFYSVQALKHKGNSIYTAGLKGTCDNQSDFFVGQYALSTSSYSELVSITNLKSNAVVKGMFEVDSQRIGFYTNNDVFIYDSALDTSYHILENLIEICEVAKIKENIVAASGSGLHKINRSNLFAVDTVLENQIRLMTIDTTENQVYIASNFFVIRLNQKLAIQDSLYLVNGPMNIAAPNRMYADANKLYMLDADRVYTTDSNFNFVLNDFSIAIRNTDTYIKTFLISNNQVLVFGAKGHYYFSKSSHPWFLGSFPLSNTVRQDFEYSLIKANVDSLYKYTLNSKNYFKARFKYTIVNNSNSVTLNNFRVNIFFDGKLCSGYSNQHTHLNLNHTTGTGVEYYSDWGTYGPIDNIVDYNSDNTRFNISAVAFNQTDYGSSSVLSLTTSSYGFIGIKENFSAIHLSPNPTNGIVSISGLSVDLEASLINSLGQTLWSGELSKNKHELDLSAFPQGAYYLQLIGEQYHVIKKILKQ